MILVIWTSFWNFWKIRKMQLICHTLSLNRHVCIDPVYRQDEYHDALMHCPIDWLTNFNLAFWMKALNCFLGNLLVTITSSLRDSNKLFPWKHCFSWKSYTHFFHAINFSYENNMKVMPIYAKRSYMYIMQRKLTIFIWKSCDCHSIFVFIKLIKLFMQLSCD